MSCLSLLRCYQGYSWVSFVVVVSFTAACCVLERTGYWLLARAEQPRWYEHGATKQEITEKRVPKRQGSATWRGDCPFAPTRRSPSDRLGASRYSSQARGVRQVVVGEKDCGDRCDQSAAVLGNKRGLAHLLPARLLRASRTAAPVWVSKNRKKKKVRTRTTTECYCSRRARGRESGVERTSWLCLPGFLMTTRPFCASVAV